MLQTGQEITELDSSGFITSSPTVFAGNIGEKKYILQVMLFLLVKFCFVPISSRRTFDGSKHNETCLAVISLTRLHASL